MIYHALGRHKWRPYIIVSLLFFNACFGHVDKRGSVTGIQGNTVFTEGGRFRIGPLSPAWVQKDLKYRAVVFTHTAYSSSIALDAFCKGAYDDIKLSLLTNQLFSCITNQKRLSQKTVHLDNREAQRTVLEGKVDGAPIVTDVVVLKKNECVFDFSLSSVPGDYEKVRSDFEKFYQGFHYLEGPPL